MFDPAQSRVEGRVRIRRNRPGSTAGAPAFKPVSGPTGVTLERADMIYITRKMHFCAAHRLYDASLSPEENRKRFGDCVNLHGHSYELEVTLAGEPDPKSGMVVHLTELDAIARERVVKRLDHKYLNEDVDVFKDVVPTLEMLARYVWDRLDGAVPGAKLHRIRLGEDDRFYADYYGEGR